MSVHDEFVAVAEAAVDDVLRLRPDYATYEGDHRYDDQLPDLSNEGVSGFSRTLRNHQDALLRLDVKDLGAQDRVDAEVLAKALERMLFDAEVIRRHQWDLLEHEAGDPLYVLMSRDTTPLEQRVNGIKGRLEQLPDFLATTRATVTGSPRVHAETALMQLPGLRSVVTTELDRTIVDNVSLQKLIAGPREAALAAIDEHEVWLTDLAETADGDPRLGGELFRQRLPLVLDSALSADDVLARARRNLDDVTAQLHEVASSYLSSVGEDTDIAGSTLIRRALDHVARQAPTDETIVAECEAALQEAADEVRRGGMVTVPDDPVQVEVMPEFRRGVAVAYCDAPGPFEVGGTTYVAISPTPTDWPAERVTSFYREYNNAMLRNLMVHEAMPGHVLQLAHARRFKGTTRVRQLFASGPFIEGWAVLTEHLMGESGFGGPRFRLQQLKTQLRTTINAILDAGVHAGHMDEAEALSLMTDHGFQEEGEAVGKWRRAQLTSCQLSTYFVGFVELKDVLEQRGQTYPLDDMVSHGNPPPRHLTTLLDL